MKQLRQALRNETGFSLPIVLMTLTVIAILGTSIITISNNTSTVAAIERADQSVFYIAEAATVEIRAKLIDSIEKNSAAVDSVTELNDTIKSNFLTTYALSMFEPSEKAFKPYLNRSFEKHFGRETSAKYLVHYQISDNQLQYVIYTKGIIGIEGDGGVVSSRALSQVITVPLIKSLVNKQIKISPDTANINKGPIIEIDEIPHTPPVVENPDDTGEDNGGGKHCNGVGNPDCTGTENGCNGVNNHNCDRDEEEDKEPPIWETLPFDAMYAVNTYGKINLTEGATIRGKVCSSSNDVYSNGGATVSEGRCTPTEPQLPEKSKLLPAFPSDLFSDLKKLDYPSDVEVKKDSYNKTNVIENGNFQATNWITKDYTLKVQDDMKFNEFKVDQNNSITIDIGNTDKSIYINKFNVIQGSINVIGNGELNLYVENDFDIKGYLKTLDTNVKINIYYTGQSEIILANETHVTANLYTKEANLTFTGGSGFTGSIYTGGNSVKISGGNSSTGRFIIAPNANVNLSGGATIKGPIIADTFEANGGTSVTYSNEFNKKPTQ